MHLKQLLSLAAVSGVASNNLREHESINHGRQLQFAGLFPPSVQCITDGKTIDECCPDGADKDDGACTLLFCVNLEDFTVNQSCKCSQFSDACGALTLAFMFIPGMADLCSQSEICCKEGAASNVDFNACVGTALTEGGLALPDVSLLNSLLGANAIADAIAVVDAAAETTPATITATAAETATTPATITATAAETTITTAATAATTEATTTADLSNGDTTGDASATPNGNEEPSDAYKHATRAWVPLAGSFAALLLA